MKDKEIVVEELNTLLRGTFMGIRSLEHHIEKLEDEKIKKIFQFMQQEYKRNAEKIAERIQNLQGTPADSEGITGKMHSYLHKMMVSGDTREIITDALKGINQYGIEYSEELVKGDLDEESKRIVEQVIDTNRKQAVELRRLLQDA
ncbi:DUF2383 domain-containing protein [Bacillus rubiinfantis]|uniref:DUF2383 domain-containing protein n=1 Tax=Bacillus rubiinfantis TaxID=1499680 RepID=UPI0005AB88D0|nr:DUF2383 domain-containing protein [Bacillus rubiinfantis]